jgi:DNA-binding beta-propeller fold protein YncE
MRRLLSIMPLFLAAVLAAQEPQHEPQRFEQGGIAVEFSLDAVDTTQPTAGASAMATFRMTDARTGQPLPGLRPRAWLSARRSEAVASETPCTDKIRGFLGGQLSVRADADLNGYEIITLNHDRTVTFIDPQIASSISKLESAVVLSGKGADWLLSRDRNRLFVSIPETAEVAVVDTITRRLMRTIATGPGSQPGRVALSTDGATVWVALDGADRVAVIDASTLALLATPETGAGLHAITFSSDGKLAFVTNSAAGTVSILDARTYAKRTDVAVAPTPVAAAWGSQSAMLYVASLNGETLAAIDPLRGTSTTIAASRGIVALAFEPEGRFLFAVNQLSAQVTVIDSATNAIVGRAAVVAEPDQIAFTRGYAYVRGLASEKFTLIDVSGLRAGQKSELAPIAIQAGRLPATEAAGEIGAAAMIAPTPEGNSVLIANPADRTLYFYSEGMMAPLGTLDNYRRIPRGLLVLDRSLAEIAPGVFRAPVQLASAGRFDVPMLVDQPRLTHCFEARVQPGPAANGNATRARIAAEVLLDVAKVRAGDDVPIRVRIVDAATRQPIEGLRDVRLLAVELPGIWQQRQWLAPRRGGVYETRQTFPHTGTFHVLFSVESAGARYNDLPVTVVEVQP